MKIPLAGYSRARLRTELTTLLIPSMEQQKNWKILLTQVAVQLLSTSRLPQYFNITLDSYNQALVLKK